MPINNISSIKNSISPLPQHGYSRLKKIFTSDLSFVNYNEIVEQAKNSVLGNLPAEIMQAALKTKNKEQSLKTIQNGFALSANELHKITRQKAEIVTNSNPDKQDIIKTYEKILNGDWSEYDYLKQRIKNSIIDKNTVSKTEEAAAEFLKQAMKEVLPPNTNVRFKRLGEGNFAVGYKIEFRNENNEKVFPDYTMKLYKDMKQNIEINTEVENKIKETLHNLTDTEIKEMYKKFPVYKNGTNEKWTKIINEFREKYTPLTNEELKKKILFELSSRGFSLQTNGVNAEANTYAYISKAIGHPLHNTNLNVHYMFDLKNNFNLSAYSDNSLPQITKYVNYSKIGITPFDAYDNYSNMVYGRIIDVGGMAKSNELLTDKTVRKYFKKIVNRNTKKEQQAVIENLKQFAKNPKTPERRKILSAVEIAETKLNFS